MMPFSMAGCCATETMGAVQYLAFPMRREAWTHRRLPNGTSSWRTRCFERSDRP